jgi:hypothetical protein
MCEGSSTREGRSFEKPYSPDKLDKGNLQGRSVIFRKRMSKRVEISQVSSSDILRYHGRSVFRASICRIYVLLWFFATDRWVFGHSLIETTMTDSYER